MEAQILPFSLGSVVRGHKNKTI